MNTGSVTLTRYPSRLRDEGNEFVYEEIIKASNPVDFIGKMVERSPEKVFVYDTSDEYVRVATLQDMFELPTTKTVNFLHYRKDSVKKSFEVSSDGPSWARYIYELVNALLVQYRDFEMAYSEVKETITVPNLTESLLYQLILQYSDTKNTVEELDAEILVTEGQLDVLNQVFDASKAHESIAEPLVINHLVENLPQLAIQGVNLLEEAQGVGTTTSLNGIRRSLLQAGEGVIGRVENGSTSSSEAQQNINLIETIIAGATISSWGSSDAATYQRAISDAKRQIANTVTIIAPAITKINSVVDNLAELEYNTDTIANRLRRVSDTITTSAATINLTTAVAGVSVQTLEDLLRKLTTKLNSIKLKREQAFAAKQVILARILEIEPSIDPSDPMKIYNYRVFRLASNS